MLLTFMVLYKEKQNTILITFLTSTIPPLEQWEELCVVHESHVIATVKRSLVTQNHSRHIEHMNWSK